jgi:hypothetical protein
MNRSSSLAVKYGAHVEFQAKTMPFIIAPNVPAMQRRFLTQGLYCPAPADASAGGYAWFSWSGRMQSVFPKSVIVSFK